MLESKLNLMVSKVPFMAERSDPEREVLRQLGSLCFTRRGPVSPLGGGQSPVHVGSMTRDFLAGIPGQAGPEACRGPRPAGPGEKAGQDATSGHHLPSSWRRKRSAALLGPFPLPPCILHVITKCNLAWGAEGFLSTSA